MAPAVRTLDHLLTKTERLFRTLHVVRGDFGLQPTKQHIASCMNYIDLQQMREEFVEALVEATIPFVYSREKQQELLQRLSADAEVASAWMQLLRMSRQKFRSTDLKGQFSELLLCNVLQHFFKAAPVVRKMKITTNPGVERHGADAIHVAVEGERYRLYIGEAKTFHRAKNALREGLEAAITDVVEKHSKHRAELNLYVYEDFIPPELEEVVIAYREGRLPTAAVELVCLVTYDAPEGKGASRDEILANIVEQFEKEARKAAASSIFAKVDKALLPRLNYVMVPMSNLDEVLSAFKRELGVGAAA